MSHRGRDILSRILYGTRISLRIGFLGMLLGCVVGVILGLFAGYHGGWAVTVIMRLLDVQLAFAGLLGAICIIAIIGPGLENVIDDPSSLCDRLTQRGTHHVPESR